MSETLLVRLILLLPLAGAVLTGVVPLFVRGLRRQETLLGGLATLMVALPFVFAAMLFAGYDGEPVVARFYTWMAAGDLSVDFAYRVDALSLVMTLIVTGVGALIHLYSMGYMHGDPGYWRFFSYLNLFIFAMLNLVLGDNLPVLFLGWEGVGLCSYLLIGFWYSDSLKSLAASKAFIVNRVGDFAFLLAMFILFRALGGLDFETLLASPEALPQSTLNWAVLLLFIGATGKSAQIPLFVWLPDAMAGPTPVSALIHAATMVTSGLYLLARLSPLVLSAPAMMAVVAVVGALTALMAATIAITQNDIKRVLAYSTVSQLGFMFMAAGVGAFFVAIFHVMTHAFFKACLFLGSGSVIHGMHEVEHELAHRGHGGHVSAAPDEHLRPTNKYQEPFDPQDMRTMGGLKKYMPITHITFLVATLAIAGIPLLSGFFSKDEILFKAFEYGYDGHAYAWFVWVVGLFTALLTAFYMTRSYVLTFRGKERWPLAEEGVKPHESPPTMTIPLVVLAVLSVVGGYVGLPGVVAHGEWNLIHHFLGAPYGGPVAEPEGLHHVPLGIEWGLIVLGSLVAIVGVALGWRLYDRRGLAQDERLRTRLGGLYRVWQHKYGWDELYDGAVVQPLLRFSDRGLARFDQRVVDGAVNGVARLAAGFSRVLRPVQTGIVQNYALAIVLGVVIVVALFLFG